MNLIWCNGVFQKLETIKLLSIRITIRTIKSWAIVISAKRALSTEIAAMTATSCAMLQDAHNEKFRPLTIVTLISAIRATEKRTKASHGAHIVPLDEDLLRCVQIAVRVLVFHNRRSADLVHATIVSNSSLSEECFASNALVLSVLSWSAIKQRVLIIHV